MTYKHTQPGYLVFSIIFFFLILFTFIQIKTKLYLEFLPITILFVFFIISFSTLTVKIDRTNLQIKFGYGIFKKKFPLKEITSAKTVQNRWYYGWGIRVWFWPYMWIYNISGFDAVEIKMKNNKIYRIGTDEPKKLKQAILKSIK